jgi:hypothetical protein
MVSEEFFATKFRPTSFRVPYVDNIGMDITKAIGLAKNLMLKFDGISCEPKTDAMLIMSDPDRAKDVQSYLNQTGYKLAKQPISDEIQEDIENTNLISPSIKFHTKDLDADKRESKPWQTDNRIRSVKEQDIKKSSIDGMSKIRAKSYLWEQLKLTEVTKKFYNDTSWKPISGENGIYKKLESMGIDYTITGTRYRHDNEGVPTSKIWENTLKFKNDKGKEIILYMNIIAAGAGSIQDPLDRYDLTVIIS